MVSYPNPEDRLCRMVKNYGTDRITKPVTVEEALEIIGVGKIQYLAVLASFLCLMHYVLDVLGISLIIPVATCDLQLTTSKKGLLISFPFLGLTLTAHLWGFLADSIGRRKSIVLSLCATILFSLLSALAPHFWIMLLARFLSGLSFAGASSTMYPYLGELLTDGTRSKLMILIGYALGFGMFVMSVVAWTVQNYFRTIQLTESHAITPWRLQMIILLFPGVIGAVLYYFLPESPKFLVSIGESGKALDVLRRIHQSNSGWTATFPIDSLEEDAATGHIKCQKMSEMLRNMIKETRELFRRPSFWPMVGACFILYGLFTVGAGFLMWFPEITNRLSENIPGTAVCEIFASSAGNGTVIEDSNWAECSVDIQDKMYIDHFVIGLGYLVSNTIFYLFAKKIKLLSILIFSMVISSASAFLLPSLTNQWAILVCFTLLLTGASSGIHIFNILIVEIFPNTLCGMALSIASLAGRAGTFIGANELGLLLESHCEGAIYGIAILIAACVVCVRLLPKKVGE